MGADQESRRMILPDELRSMAESVGLEMPQAGSGGGLNVQND